MRQREVCSSDHKKTRVRQRQSGSDLGELDSAGAAYSIAVEEQAARIRVVENAVVFGRGHPGVRVDKLDDEGILRLNLAVLVSLGLAVSPRVSRQG